MTNINLNKLLMEVIDTYGKNEGYSVPTISWSEENMWSRFGEYQFWHNHIIISNLFKTGAVSENAIKSVIFHEYTHQIYKDHNEAFNKRMSLFKGYSACQRELDDYINGITELPDARKTDILIDEKQELMFCKLPYNPDDEDSYWNSLWDFNHFIMGILPFDLPEKYCKNLIKQVIWVVEILEKIFVVGWSRNVQLYSTIQKADFSACSDLGQFGLNIIEYQFKYRQADGKWLFPSNVLCILDKGECPVSLQKNGICNADEIEGNILKEVVEIINSYNSDYNECGIRDDTLDCIPGVETEDVSELINMAEAMRGMDRAFLIMNKAVSLEKSYRTYLNRGLAFCYVWVLDRAVEDLSKALEYENSSNEEVGKEEVERLIEQLKEVI